jgi:hypothetical protein
VYVPTSWPEARKVSGWPKRSKLAHAFLWGYSYKGMQLAQLLGQFDIFLTWDSWRARRPPRGQAGDQPARAIPTPRNVISWAQAIFSLGNLRSGFPLGPRNLVLFLGLGIARRGTDSSPWQRQSLQLVKRTLMPKSAAAAIAKAATPSHGP